jgi:N-carbamoyl-L-amino-acid hydrolase
MLWQTRESCGIDQMIRINGKRLLADLRELASFGAFKTGVDRIALSAEDIAARRWLVGKLAAAGLNASMDRVGNVLGCDPNAKKAILIGSHTDTVPKGGWLDGALGVGYALEIARSAIEANEPHATGVDAISFEDEEGTYLPFLGSRSFFADLGDNDIAAAKSKDGASLAAALATIATEPPPHRFDAKREVCYLEAHIEQGPRMEAGGNRIGVVTGLVGIKRFRLKSHGAANHAGTTPMAMRKDAGAALIALAAGIGDDMRRLAGPDTVWNIGNMIFRPGAANVVPSEGEMLLEFRDIDGAVMERLEERFRAGEDRDREDGEPRAHRARPEPRRGDRGGRGRARREAGVAAERRRPRRHGGGALHAGGDDVHPLDRRHQPRRDREHVRRRHRIRLRGARRRGVAAARKFITRAPFVQTAARRSLSRLRGRVGEGALEPRATSGKGFGRFSPPTACCCCSAIST